jgi:hypothetical protein
MAPSKFFLNSVQLLCLRRFLCLFIFFSICLLIYIFCIIFICMLESSESVRMYPFYLFWKSWKSVVNSTWCHEYTKSIDVAVFKKKKFISSMNKIAMHLHHFIQKIYYTNIHIIMLFFTVSSYQYTFRCALDACTPKVIYRNLSKEKVDLFFKLLIT